MPYKAIRKNPSAAPVAPDILAALREIPVAALSDNMHRNIGSTGLHPYHRPMARTMAGTAVTARSRGATTSRTFAPSSSAGPATCW